MAVKNEVIQKEQSAEQYIQTLIDRGTGHSKLS